MPASSPDPIGASLKLAKALALARRGQLEAAQALLTESGGSPEDPIELHALAALVTSAGDFPRALALWRQLLQRDPRHAEALRMIDAIELWESRPPWYRFIPAGVAALGIVLLVIVVLYALS
jgi:predicted Zn-dependent protease